MTFEELYASIVTSPEQDRAARDVQDSANRHRIYNATTDALRAELAGIADKGVALLISWELQRRGEGHRWPFKRARQRSWNRA